MTARKPTVVEIQLVVGTTREGMGWTPVAMTRYPSGWQGSFKSYIEGKEVSLSIHLPLNGHFDVPEPDGSPSNGNVGGDVGGEFRI